MDKKSCRKWFPGKEVSMELFPVFLFGISFAFVGAVALTAYIFYKVMELP